LPVAELFGNEQLFLIFVYCTIYFCNNMLSLSGDLFLYEFFSIF